MRGTACNDAMAQCGCLSTAGSSAWSAPVLPKQSNKVLRRFEFTGLGSLRQDGARSAVLAGHCLGHKKGYLCAAAPHPQHHQYPCCTIQDQDAQL